MHANLSFFDSYFLSFLWSCILSSFKYILLILVRIRVSLFEIAYFFVKKGLVIIIFFFWHMGCSTFGFILTYRILYLAKLRLTNHNILGVLINTSICILRVNRISLYKYIIVSRKTYIVFIVYINIIRHYQFYFTNNN